MRWPSLAFLALPAFGRASQISFQLPAKNASDIGSVQAEQKHNILTVEEFVELERPGVGVANFKGDLVLVPVSKFSIEERQYVHGGRFKHIPI